MQVVKSLKSQALYKIISRDFDVGNEATVKINYATFLSRVILILFLKRNEKSMHD